MSKIEEYINALGKHKKMGTECLDKLNPESSYNYEITGAPSIIIRNPDGNWNHVNTRVVDFLKEAIKDRLQELIRHAMVLSEQNVLSLKEQAQDEAISFIKSLGATESNKEKNHGTQTEQTKAGECQGTQIL